MDDGVDVANHTPIMTTTATAPSSTLCAFPTRLTIAEARHVDTQSKKHENESK